MHGYAIMVHKNLEQIKRLINAIDDERNEIHIHIDKKSKIIKEDILNLIPQTKAKIFVYKEISVYWASFKQTKAELYLFKNIIKNNRIKYIHLLSESCYPLKSQNYIHSKLLNSNDLFIGFNKDNMSFAENSFRYYNFLIDKIDFRKYKIIRGFNKISKNIQKLFGINRLNNFDIQLRHGSNWCTITYEFCHYLLENERFVVDLFENTEYSDEMYKQTIAINSKYKNNLENDSEICSGSLRYIDWEKRNGSSPKTLVSEDFDKIINTPFLFARKLDLYTDKKIFDLIDKKILMDDSK